MRSLVLAVLLVFTGTAVGAEGDQVRLFSEFNAGVGYEQVSREAGMRDATGLGLPNVSLSRPDQAFAGSSVWTQLFAFRNGRLTDVMLVADFDLDLYNAAVQTLTAAKFNLVYVESNERTADCIALLKALPFEEASGFIDALENEALRGGFIGLSFIDEGSMEAVVPGYDPQGFPSQLAGLLPPKTRAVHLTASVLSDEPFIRIVFSAPVYTAGLLKKDN